MLWLSALLVFGTAAFVVGHLAQQDGELHLGFQQLIHARIPWILLGGMWTGGLLGGVALARRRSWQRTGVVLLELLLIGLASAYFLSVSFLPGPGLDLEVGDAFPSYALLDQDGQLQRYEAGRARGPALYIFYRGDW